MNPVVNYFPELTPKQVAQLEQLPDLYADWNQKVNLISRKDIGNIVVNHILHSMSVAKVIQFKAGTKIIDVGTGGGFPAIPLAILFPDAEFTAIDSIGKKTNVTRSVSESIGLSNLSVLQIRSNEMKAKFDFVTARAVTNFPDFVDLVKHLVGSKDKNALPNGILYLKGGDFMQEIKLFSGLAEIYSISEFFSEPYFETKKIIYLPC